MSKMDVKNWLHDYYLGLSMGVQCKDCDDAAGLIESLAAERDRYKAALERISTRGYNADPYIELQRNSDIAREALTLCK